MPRMSVNLSLDKFRVVKTNESSDEPYLWVVFVKVDGSTLSLTSPTSSSVSIHAPAGSHGDLGSASDDMDSGDVVTIPTDIGRWDTELGTVDGAAGSLPETLPSVGALVVGLDEDGTSDSAAEAGRKALVDALNKELTNSIRNGVAPSIAGITPQQIQDAQNAVVDA